MRKRLVPLLVAITAALAALTACSQPRAVDVSGTWEGEVGPQGASYPVTYTIGPDNELQDSDFHLVYESEDLSYEVTSSVVGDRFLLTADAESPDGTIAFRLEATVADYTMEGEYWLDVVPTTGGELHLNGSFTAHRVPATS